MREQTLFMPADATVDNLEILFHDAYLKVERHDDDELCVTETFKIWVKPVKDGQRIHFYSIFSAGETSTYIDRLEYVNQVNDELMLIRASLVGTKKEALYFDYYVFVEGGVSKRAIVLALKDFASALEVAIDLDTRGAVS